MGGATDTYGWQRSAVTVHPLRTAAARLRDGSWTTDAHAVSVGFVVADWLEVEADKDDPCHAPTPADCYIRDCNTHRALAVANAVLADQDVAV